MSERSAPKDNFKFASGDDCTEQVKEELRSLGCPVDEYQFDWFSTSGEDYAILEKRALDDGMIDSQRAKQDGWTEANNSYEIYGWQLYEGLQVLPPAFKGFASRHTTGLIKTSPLLIFPKHTRDSCPLLFFSFENNSLNANSFMLLLSFLIFPDCW